MEYLSPGRSLLLMALSPILSTFFLVSDSSLSQTTCHSVPPKHGKDVQSMEAGEPGSLGVTPVSAWRLAPVTGRILHRPQQPPSTASLRATLHHA